MSRYEATMAQTRAVGRLNIQLDVMADRFIRRLYEKREPLGTANDALRAHLLSSGLVRAKNGSLLELTRDGEDYAEAM